MARRRPDRGVQRPLPRQGAEAHGRAAPRASARRASRSLRARGLEGRSLRRSGRGPEGTPAAGDHQRPPDGRYGRGRPPVRRQRDDRRRGAAVCRGDEGGGLPPRAAHGEGGELDEGEDRARHRQGRRARHRQEPGRHHSQQQRLPGDQSGDQGAAGGPAAGVPRAPARCDRPVRPAGEVGADDGGDGAGPEGRRRALPHPGRRRRPVEPLHAAQDRARVRRPGGLCERCDDRPRSRQPAHGRDAPRPSSRGV